MPLGAALCALVATVVLASCGGGPSPEDAEAYVTEQLEAEGGEVRSVICDEDNSGTRYECNVEFANEVIDERAGGLTVVEKDEID